MSKTLLPDPRRWIEESTEDPAGAKALGAAFRRVREATDPSPSALQRLTVRRNRRAPHRRSQRLWHMVAVGALIMAMAGAVGAALTTWPGVDLVGILGLRRDDVSRGPLEMRRQHEVARRSNARSAANESAIARAAPANALDPQQDGAEEGRREAVQPSPHTLGAGAVSPGGERALRPEKADRRSTSASSATSAPPGEADTLAAVFRELRSGGDPAAVLRALDAHDHRFPNGTLRGEAGIARAEALLALGRRQEALPLLKQIEASGGTVTRDVRITRGELLAEAGHCAQAVDDFAAVLASSKHDAAAARALFGRASCRLGAGETGPARADLEEYVALHPEGPSAQGARHALESLP